MRLIESPLQSESVHASGCSGSLLFRIMIPIFCVSQEIPAPSRRNLRRSASPGDASVLLTSWTANAIFGLHFKRCLRMPTHLWQARRSASPSLRSSSSRHRLALVVADTQDVQNVLDVSLAWCNVNGDRTCPCSRCMDVTVL